MLKTVRTQFTYPGDQFKWQYTQNYTYSTHRYTPGLESEEAADPPCSQPMSKSGSI